MAIIENTTDSEPLSQGDILQGITLFASKIEGPTYIGAKVASEFCIVLSRPCVAAHKRSLVVARIEAYSSSIPSNTTASFDEFRSFLVGCRGGFKTPDLFYLGKLPDREGRFCARLDSIHTIGVPPQPAELQNFINKHRFARLSEDFSKDLHLRFFQAFASLGFDDLNWFCYEDLEMLVKIGQSEVEAMRREEGLKAERQGFAGTETKGKDPLKLEQAEAKLKPYLDELQRRKAQSA